MVHIHLRIIAHDILGHIFLFLFLFCFFVVVFAANRTEPNLCDLSQTFRSLDVDLGELAEFLRQVDSQPLEQRVSRFPVPRNSTHVYHGPGSFGEVTKKRSRAPSLSSEDEEYDHIPSYLPPFPSQRRESVKGESV